jgi:L-rhamnose mutarotase
MSLEGYSWPLRRGAAASYIARHHRPWPELTPMFRDHGVATFSIYTDGDRVFMHSEVTDASSWPSAWETDLHQRWGKLVEPYIHVTDALAPAVTPLTLVYHQPRAAG